MRTPLLVGLCILSLGCAGSSPFSRTTAPLPSWNNGEAKQQIVAFVAQVTDPTSPRFVPPEERIAVFDNDGTLWAERPFYFQLLFAIDRIHEMAPEHPDWKSREPYASILAGEPEKALAGGEKAILELIMATHAGMTSAEFEQAVEEWLENARHPKTGRPYTEMVYQPMLELLGYLRAHGFQTYIVSGGGIEFMRPWTDRVYGIPPQQVVGSSVVTRFEQHEKGPILMRLAEIDFIDDKAGKPVGINKFIGRRPILAFGNSDGDLQMLEWTAAGSGARFMGLVHHTDDTREWKYDRDSHIGLLDAALDEGHTRAWTVVDMKRDWNQIFPSPDSD